MAVDFDYLYKRYDEFWNRANEDRPLVNMFGPAGGNTITPAPHHKDMKEAWLDTEFQIARMKQMIDGNFYLGEGYPMFNPNLGPDLLGAICGCDLKFSNRTSWADPILTDYETFPKITFDENNFWWKKICEITEAALKDAEGNYIVGITDLHPGADGLVSLRGPQDAAYDIYDEPEQIKARIWELYDVFTEIITRLHGLISAKQRASSNWMGILHPTELWYPPSCDFSCMISPDNFEEFIIPELEAEIEFLPHSIYHLDGPDALRHLDRLLQIEKLEGIQWVYGAGQPSARHWGDVLKKIQAAGKRIMVYCEPEDLVPLCEILDPRGVHFRCILDDKERGAKLLEEMERTTRAQKPQFFVK